MYADVMLLFGGAMKEGRQDTPVAIARMEMAEPWPGRWAPGRAELG